MKRAHEKEHQHPSKERQQQLTEERPIHIEKYCPRSLAIKEI